MSARIDRAAQSFLRIFVKPDQTYDFESNLLNRRISPSWCAIRSRSWMVLIQAKNKQMAPSDDSLLTLNPGWQYLTNDQRIWVINSVYHGDKAKKRPIISEHMGYGSPVWNDHVDFCLQHPPLGDECIRISLNTRPVSETLLKWKGQGQ